MVPDSQITALMPQGQKTILITTKSKNIPISIFFSKEISARRTFPQETWGAAKSSEEKTQFAVSSFGIVFFPRPLVLQSINTNSHVETIFVSNKSYSFKCKKLTNQYVTRVKEIPFDTKVQPIHHTRLSFQQQGSGSINNTSR